MIGHILGYLPLNGGYWKTTNSPNWSGLNYLETVLNFSDLPHNTYGKLYVEWVDDMKEGPDHYLEVRLSYQQKVAIKVPIEGSEIKKSVNKRWQLDESDWFRIPTEVDKVSCLWVEGRAPNGGRCSVALANVMLVTRA